MINVEKLARDLKDALLRIEALEVRVDDVEQFGAAVEHVFTTPEPETRPAPIPDAG